MRGINRSTNPYKVGFERCLSDSGIYVRDHKSTITAVIVYVDDVLFMGSHDDIIAEVKKQFMKVWECRDLGKVKEYLGMTINYNRPLGTLVINQSAYARKVVQCFGLENCKPTCTPLPTGYSHLPNTGQATSEE